LAPAGHRNRGRGHQRPEGIGWLLPTGAVRGRAGYAASFYFLSLSLREIPLGVVYAVWSGIGTAAIALIGVVFFQETLGWVGIGGIVLIVLGVVLLNASGAHN
jgi:small multidrug resistance pump